MVAEELIGAARARLSSTNPGIHWQLNRYRCVARSEHLPVALQPEIDWCGLATAVDTGTPFEFARSSNAGKSAERFGAPLQYGMPSMIAAYA